MSIFRSLVGACGLACAVVPLAPPAFAVGNHAPHDDEHMMIVDGRVAQEGPWAARLMQDDVEMCTSTVVAPKWVLTAYHCVKGAEDELNFNIGSLNQHEGKNYKAKKGGVRPHDDGADIALVELEEPVDVTPAPLLEGPDAVKVGQSVQVYGWGATTPQGEPIDHQSPVLKVADVKVTGLEGRDDRFGVAIDAERGDGIPGGGDSGGPMFAEAPNGDYVQVGVASTSDSYNITSYTKLSEYRGWIEEVAGV